MATLVNIARWPTMLVLVALALACIYRYGPSRDEPKWRWLTWGSAFAAVAWMVFSALFSFYAGHFGTFNKTYGSLDPALFCAVTSVVTIWGICRTHTVRRGMSRSMLK
jgi:membrane protein